MAPVRRPINEPMLTEAEFHRERCRIYNYDWDIEDMETNTEGAFTPYVPTRADLDAWLAHWRAIYPEKLAPGKGGGDQAIPVTVPVKEVVAVAVKAEVTHKLPDDCRRRSRGRENDVLETVHDGHEGHVDAGVGVDWEPLSEGVEALEEGMGGRMEQGVKALVRKLRK